MQFTTKTAVEWASANEATLEFSGTASHIATRDACVVAPASANIIAKVAHGITDTPESALIASYLGSNKPVIILPNMHDSLAESPMVAKNLRTVAEFCTMLEPRLEEGKRKFPDPKSLADEVAHGINFQKDAKPALIAMGTTRGYIDDVRYISNYSSGALGTAISEELYRFGFSTEVVCGPCIVKPKVFSNFHPIETNDELKNKSLELVESLDCHVIFAASVLDYIPSSKQEGKIKSSQELEVEFAKTEKILSLLNPKSSTKVGFKLEASIDLDKARAISSDYMKRYNLQFMVLNGLNAVDQTRHEAYIFKKTKNDVDHIFLQSKADIASEIAGYLIDLH